MNEKETGEIRRRLKTDKCAVGSVYGCFVNEKREIVSEFKNSLGQMYKDDSDSLLNIMRKTLSGTIGKNLIDLEFETSQVVDSDEHRLLSDMRSPGANSDGAVHFFFEQASQCLIMDGCYMMLVIQDAYDVPAFHSDGTKNEEGSDEVFNYCLCAVCPVKDTKPALGYFLSDNAFRLLSADRVLCPPELGFMFPTFDDRQANIYNVLYYSKKTDGNHPEFIENVLHMKVPMPADEQKETFNGILTETLDDSCSLDVAVAVRNSICEQINEYKTEKKNEEPPMISKHSVARVLSSCGVDGEKVEAFKNRYDESFGAQAELAPGNFVNMRELEVATPDVSIKINSERSDLVETRVIDGVRYILIRAENGVEVNGVSVKIN